MSDQPGSLTRPHRLSLNVKLGAVFILLALLGSASLYLLDTLRVSTLDIAHTISQSAQLHHLSHEVALHASSFVPEQSEAARLSVRDAQAKFKANYAQLSREIAQLPALMRSADDPLEARLERIDATWQRQRVALQGVLAGRDLAARQAAQREVAASAGVMLGEADSLVGALEKAAHTANQRVGFIIHLMQALGILLVIGVFFYMRLRVIAPILKLAVSTRRFAAGERSVRTDFESSDEIGELARAFNATAAQTAALVDELDRRGQENAVLAGILAATTDIVCSVAPDGRVLYLNRAGRTMLGLTEREDFGRYSIADFHSPEEAERILHIAQPAAAQYGIWSGESVLRSHVGVDIPVSQVTLAHRNTDGAVDYYSSIMRDTVHANMLRQRMQTSVDFHLKLMHEFPNPIWRVDRSGKCDYVNRAWLEFTGRAEEDELGDGWTVGLHPEDKEHSLATFLSAFNRRESFTMEYRLRHSDGSYHWLLGHGAPYTDLDDEFAGYLGTCYDVNDRKLYESQLEYQAQHDALTGLPNRNLLDDRIKQVISRVGRHGSLVGVVFLDLDNFKVVNDSLGHQTGDHILREVGRRLAAAVREGDTVARYSGDEFVVVLADVAQEEDMALALGKLTATMSAPFTVDDRDIAVSASLGVAVCPRDGEDTMTLLRNADTALHRAKDAGRNTFQFYSADMNQRLLTRLDLERDLRQALEKGEFLLYYQPQVKLASGAIIGTEALVRWRHPVRGLVAPGEFIPLAEETGLIVPLGAWVLREACRQARMWFDAGLPEITLSVNLSARQFRAPGLAQAILDVLAETGMAARLLELEITESMLVQDPHGAIAVLDALRQHGVAFALDDFGTGYSSLSYLKRFPIHKLKIDQSFVRDITTDTDDAAIANAVIELGHGLGLTVIAEGVETDAQRAFLAEHGCDEMQGYLFSRPVPASEMAALLAAGRSSLLPEGRTEPDRDHH